MLTYKGGAYVTHSVDTLRTGTQRKGWPRTGSQRGSAVTGQDSSWEELLLVARNRVHWRDEASISLRWPVKVSQICNGFQ